MWMFNTGKENILVINTIASLISTYINHSITAVINIIYSCYLNLCFGTLNSWNHSPSEGKNGISEQVSSIENWKGNTVEWLKLQSFLTMVTR